MKLYRIFPITLLVMISLVACSYESPAGQIQSSGLQMQPEIADKTPPADESKSANEIDMDNTSWPDPLSIEADLNGDGINDMVELHSKNHDYERYVRATVAGESDEVFIANLVVEDERLTQLFAIDGDRNGTQEVVLTIYTNGSAGGNILFVLQWTNSQLGFIELPKLNPGPNYYEEANGSSGFPLQVKLLDGYCVNVYSPGTNQPWLFHIDVNYKDMAKAWEMVYDSNGEIVEARSNSYVDPAMKISQAERDGRPCIEVEQYIWGYTHPNGIAYLTTDFVWEDGRCIILEQQCVPYGDWISLAFNMQ